MLLVTMWEFSQGIHQSWWWAFWSTSLMPFPPIRVSNLNTFLSLAMVNSLFYSSYNAQLQYNLLGNSAVQYVLPYPAGSAKWQTNSRIPACPLAKALTYLLDITTPPSQSFLHKLSHMTKQVDHRQRLLALAKVTLFGDGSIIHSIQCGYMLIECRYHISVI